MPDRANLPGMLRNETPMNFVTAMCCHMAGQLLIMCLPACNPGKNAYVFK